MNTTNPLSQDKTSPDHRIAHLELLRLFEDLLMAKDAARAANQPLNDTDPAGHSTVVSAEAGVAQVSVGP